MPHDHHDHDSHALLPPDPALRVRALETLLTEKGLIDPAALDAILDIYETKIGPQIGARVVARAWREPDFLAALRADASRTLGELGLLGRQGEHIRIVENSPEVHNLVVCTLCSCYPWPLLGIPPGWYKSDAYRARAVREPRAVLAEFGLHLPEGQRVAVWDSTSEIRYLVIPMRPPESAGLSEDELTHWISRDAMIGTALARPPATESAAS